MAINLVFIWIKNGMVEWDMHVPQDQENVTIKKKPPQPIHEVQRPHGTFFATQSQGMSEWEKNWQGRESVRSVVVCSQREQKREMFRFEDVFFGFEELWLCWGQIGEDTREETKKERKKRKKEKRKKKTTTKEQYFLLDIFLVGTLQPATLFSLIYASTPTDHNHEYREKFMTEEGEEELEVE